MVESERSSRRLPDQPASPNTKSLAQKRSKIIESTDKKREKPAISLKDVRKLQEKLEQEDESLTEDSLSPYKLDKSMS